MAYDGTLKFDTAMNTKGFQADANKLGGIVKGLGVFKIIEKGMQAITASIDGAVSRYDTLNRFPKIMEKMGFSAGEADASMRKLSDGVQGLPTALDGIVGTAQRVASMTGDLNGATDVTLALNNAFLASGASSDAAGRGMEQYMQIIGRGKPEMEDWKTLQETMPYALGEVARSFGYAGESATRDFYAALQSGEITVAQMNARFVELSNATGGFAETAKTATGGIGAAFTIMKTAIVRGVAGVITSIDEGLSETRFQSIETIIKGTGKVFEFVLGGVASAFGFIAQHINAIIPIVAAFGASFLVSKLPIDAVVNSIKNAAMQAAAHKAATEALTAANVDLADSSEQVSQKEQLKAAKATAAEAAQARATATTLENTDAHQQALLQDVKCTAQKLKSTAQIEAEEIAEKAAAEAKKAATAAGKAASDVSKLEAREKKAVAIASKENATESQKLEVKKLQEELASKKVSAAVLQESANKKQAAAASAQANVESMKSVQYKAAEKAVTAAQTTAEKTAAEAKKASTAATELEAEAAAKSTVIGTAKTAQMSLGTAVIGLFTGATTLQALATAVATAATQVFAVALNVLLGPIGLITAAVGALTWIFTAVSSAVKEANKEYYAEKDALKALEEKHENYASALQASKDAASEEAQAKIVQAQNNQALLNSMAGMIDANGKYKGSSEQAKAAVKQLNKNIDGLGAAFDETTGCINMSSDELRKYGKNLTIVVPPSARADALLLF